MSTLQPAWDWIIVERPSPRSPSGLVLQRDPNPNAPKRAKVIAVGPGRPSEYGGMIVPPVEVGDEVVTGNGGLLLEAFEDGGSRWIIKPGEILAVVDRDDLRPFRGVENSGRGFDNEGAA